LKVDKSQSQVRNRAVPVKFVAAVIGGGAVVVMGALSIASTTAGSGDGIIVQGSGMSTGVTVTQSTPPSVPDTSLAVPAVKATPK
jgi:hypothetical protein